jgi:hypothetical protein
MPRRPMEAVHVGGLMQELSLGAVMKIMPKKLVDQALKQTDRASVRQRLLPATMVVYLVVLLALHSEVSVRENLRILLEPLRRKFGLEKTTVAGGTAITFARKRLGIEPLGVLFGRVARPVGTAKTPGCFWRGYRLVAVDATTVDIQNTQKNRDRFGIHQNQHGEVGYPQVKIAAMVECGTRVPLAFTYGPGTAHEPTLWDSQRTVLQRDMILMADRAYYSFERWRECSKLSGALIWRVRSTLKLKPIEVFEDGSFLAEIRPSNKLVRKGLADRKESMIVRVVEYEPVFEDGSRGEIVRLITTLLDPEEVSAEELAHLYTERWEIETGFDELKTHLRGPKRVLRSPLPDIVEQEIHGFFLAYYVVRATMADAAKKDGCAPNRLSFVHAVRVIKRRLSFFPSNQEGYEIDV